MDTVQCGSEPVDMSTGCHENEGTDHLTQLSLEPLEDGQNFYS